LDLYEQVVRPANTYATYYISLDRVCRIRAF